MLSDRAAIEKAPKGTVIIRAHGILQEDYDFIRECGHEIVDATCPFVLKIHKIVKEAAENNSFVVIVGDKNHPEVQGIKSCAGEHCVVIASEEEVENCAKMCNEAPKEVVIVSQTTFNYNKFQYLVEIFQKKGYNDSVVNTICNATEERQTAARELAQKADVMIVIGGKHSSNTRKLYEICSSECANTYFIQTLDDLHLELPKSVRLVGITAGASTPNNIIEEVQNYVRINF